MKIHYHVGSALEPVEKPAIIAHICNDIGGWGSGFVIAINNKWTAPMAAYISKSHFTLGQVDIIPVEDGICVANIIGQHGLIGPKNTSPVRYDAITTGLRFIANICRHSHTSLHIPRIGCARGGGTWDRIVQCLRESCQGIDVHVYDLPQEVDYYKQFGYPTE